jgi:LmbE family N-acetylglucosaminyl deacetylase
MLPLQLTPPAGRALSVLAIGAHPDDIEIGAGGTLLSLAARPAGLRVHYLVLTGPFARQLEARSAASVFMPGADVIVQLCDLPEGRLPAVWDRVRETIEAVASSCVPDLILAPSPTDGHQDHRTIAETLPPAFRDQLILGYELPKWDGDFGRPTMYFPLPASTAQRKVELLHKCFPSQHGHDRWDDEVFLGLARLRGMQCHAPYAEGFTCTRAVLGC